MDVPLVKASGSHQELGYKHGQEFRELIKNHSRELLSGLNSRNALLTFSRNYLPFLERTAPHLLEELRGISQGADVAFDEILALNLSPDFNGNKEGCTTFAISRQLMDDDDVLVAQNADYFPRTDDYTVLLQLTLPSGIRIATLTEAGTVGTAGMNSEGLVRVGNGLYSDQRALSGQPYYFLRRRMLEQESAEDALRVAREYPRSQPSGHLLADTSGRILYAEMLSEEDRVLNPQTAGLGTRTTSSTVTSGRSRRGLWKTLPHASPLSQNSSLANRHTILKRSKASSEITRTIHIRFVDMKER